MDGLAATVANQRYSLPRVGRRRGHRELPYFYAVDLEELFDYATGRIQMRPAAVEERCDTVMKVLFTSASGQIAKPDWTEFTQTALGVCILACGARLLLRQQLELTADQVMLLASWTPRHLQRSGLRPIDATADELRFEASAVAATFDRLGIPI